MGRKSPQILAHTGSPGQKNLRIQEAMSGRDYEPLVDVHFENLAGDVIGLRGIDTGSGVRVLRIPYWLGQRGMQSVYVDDDWTVDLSTATIDEVTHIGGMVDGLSLTASTDYCLFAFFDPYDSDNSKFKGFGVTTLPQTTASAVSSGTRGSEATFTVPSAESSRFNVGARVICRVGVAIGDDYNQGTVTEIVSATSMKVQLDSTYGAISETNTDLTGSGIDIVQTNFFAPKMDTTADELYPGSGTEYAYRFIGLIQVDANSDIVNFARPGQWIYSDACPNADTGNITVSAITVRCFSRCVPVSTNRMQCQLFLNLVSGTGGNTSVGVYSGDAKFRHYLNGNYRNSASGNFNNFVADQFEVDMNLSNNANTFDFTVGAGQTVRFRTWLIGYTLYE